MGQDVWHSPAMLRKHFMHFIQLWEPIDWLHVKSTIFLLRRHCRHKGRDDIHRLLLLGEEK
eukprot:12914885-Prorocentrum_lima.AAC.1